MRGADALLQPMIAAAKGLLPGAAAQAISLPKSVDDAVGVRLRFPGELSHGARSVAWFDRRTAQVLRVDAFGRQPPANRILAAAFPLHTGEVIGSAGTVVWSLAAVILIALSATGAIMWRRRHQQEKG